VFRATNVEAASSRQSTSDGTVLALSLHGVGSKSRVSRLEWIKVEIAENSLRVLRGRASEDYRDQHRMERIASAVLDELWGFTAAGPERKIGSLYADGIRFLDTNGREVFQHTIDEAWMQRRLN
jgi:hypothetical protein